MYGVGANNEFDEIDARYIIPLNRFSKNVEYTNPIRKYNEMIGRTSYDISFLVLTEPEDICKDGGLVKKTLKPGDDKCQHFDDYDYVLVKYEARLDDGTLVKKSDDYGVEFTLNDGHFCPALSIAVKTMKIGEKVILTVKPQYGFGDKGKPAHHDEGSVPPNATLQIILEFVSWKEGPKEGPFRKMVLKEGEGDDCPNEGALVKLKLIGKLQDGTVFFKKGYSDGDEVELFEFKTDEEQVIDGLDKAVLTMKKGEVALLTITPEYAFGSSESQQELAVVPPNSTVYYEVELVSFVKAKEVSDMNTEEKIEAALKKRQEAEAFVYAAEYARASKRYQKALKFIKYDTSFPDEDREIVGLRHSCNLGNACCLMKLKDYERANKYFKDRLHDFNLKRIDTETLSANHRLRCRRKDANNYYLNVM